MPTSLSQLSQQKLIRIAHSPDADDRFMFWPLRAGLLSSPAFRFEFQEADTQKLNVLAETEEPEICAISAIHYGRVSEKYQPLEMGCSVGDGYGPVVVAPTGEAARSQAGSTNKNILLTPGEKTTAHAALQILGHLYKKYEVVSIAPMEGVFQRMFALEAEEHRTHALVIHEGRLLYDSFGCELVLDLGKAWHDAFSASLPLGMNVISRSLSSEDRKILGALLKESCAFARKNKETFIALSQEKDSLYYTPLSRQDLSHYLDLYANETTECISQNDRNSFLILIQKSLEMGLLNQTKTPLAFDWV